MEEVQIKEVLEADLVKNLKELPRWKEHKFYFKCTHCGTILKVNNIIEQDFHEVDCADKYVRLECAHCRGYEFRFFKNI